MKRILCCLFGAALSVGTPSQASEDASEIIKVSRTQLDTEDRVPALKIVSWNIANLAEAPGKMLRGGYERSREDFEYLRTKISDIDADVIAFQEIGSSAGLELILNTTTYDYAFESRCVNNETSCQSDTGDIYTAIAYKRNLEGASVFQLDQLSVMHEDECGERRSVRGGVGVAFEYNGGLVYVPSLHLKASCKDDQIEPGTEDDCATQKLQVEQLMSWMESIPTDDLIILAGDFNRKLLNKNDSIRQLMDNRSGASSLIYLPNKEQRTCWARSDYTFDFKALSDEARRNNPELDKQNVAPQIYTGRSNQEIDFFVVRGALEEFIDSSDQIEMSEAYRFQNPGGTLTMCDGKTIRKFEGQDRGLVFGESYPSDHCPIILQIAP